MKYLNFAFLAVMVSGVAFGSEIDATCNCDVGSQNGRTLCDDHLRSLLSSESNDDEEGMLELAELYYAGFKVVDKKRSAELYLKLAESGDGNSMYWVGRFYRYGVGFEQDYEKAIRWFKKGSIEKKNVLCCVQLVQLYQPSSELHDEAEFVQWVELAEILAEEGGAKSKYYIGTSYKYGSGFQKDIGKALIWLERAAVAGSSAAMCDLIDIYYMGDEKYQDHARARQWLDILKEVDPDWRVKLAKIVKTDPEEVEVVFAKVEYGLMDKHLDGIKSSKNYPIRKSTVMKRADEGSGGGGPLGGQD